MNWWWLIFVYSLVQAVSVVAITFAYVCHRLTVMNEKLITAYLSSQMKRSMPLMPPKKEEEETPKPERRRYF